jgi:hypothetical protein
MSEPLKVALHCWEMGDIGVDGVAAGTCMLPLNHVGPHVFTPSDEVRVKIESQQAETAAPVSIICADCFVGTHRRTPRAAPTEQTCPRCGIRPRMMIAFEDTWGTQGRRLAHWCNECLGTP